MKRILLFALLAVAAAAQAVPLQKAVALTAATVYVSPDLHSTPVGSVQPGDAVAIQATDGALDEVFTGVSGWMLDAGVLRLDTPNAARILFGAAVKLENDAENDSGATPEAQGASHLYLAVYNNFPHSPLAPAALYRGAEIEFQLKLAQMPRHLTPGAAFFPRAHDLQQVESKFPHTPWAARAAYHLLARQFNCGDWTDYPSCAEKGIGVYQDYANKYPSGPYAAEAAYDSLYRAGIAWTLYRAPGKHHNAGKARKYAALVATDAARMQSLYPDSDWTAQAALVAYNVARHTPLTIPGITPLGGP